MLTNNKIIVFDLPTQTDIKIIPIFDVHIGASEFCEQEFLEYLGKYKDDPNAYFVIGGDLVNNSIKSSVANPFEETMRPSEQKRYACKLLEPIKDRIICAVSGNHEERSRKETDDDIIYDICAKLDIEDRYREDIAFCMVRIPQLDQPSRKNRSYCYSMVVTHGNGGGATIGGSLNRLEKFGAVIENCDLLISGHTHRPATFQSARIKIDTRNKNLIREQFTIVQASSWLDYGGYSAKKMLLPTARTSQEILLDSTDKKVRVVQQ